MDQAVARRFGQNGEQVEIYLSQKGKTAVGTGLRFPASKTSAIAAALLAVSAFK